MRRVGPLRASDPEFLGPYRLIGRLGTGGQGVVFLATDRSSRQVAVKTLHEGLTDDPEAAQRFTKELAAAQKVAPFCTAQVLDANITTGRPYIVSEYIDGPSLAQAVAERGPLKGNELHRLAVATATALVAIHEASVVHRDLKPHNVLLGPDGPRVIDFGIARALDNTVATTTSRPFGTPAYMAPEQFAGQRVGPPADVFSWGGVIAFAATGKPAFGKDSFPAVATRITQGEPNLEGLHGALHDLVRRCLAKDPLERPTARQVLDQLLGQRLPESDSAILKVGAHTAAPPPPREPPPAETQAVTPAEAPPVTSPKMPPSTRDRAPAPRRSRRRALIVTGMGIVVATTAAILIAALAWKPPTSRAADREKFASRTTQPTYAVEPATPAPRKSKPSPRPSKPGKAPSPTGNPRPSQQAPGTLQITGCAIDRDTNSCSIKLTALGGPARWRVTYAADGIEATGSGTLAPGQSDTVTARHFGPCRSPEAAGESAVVAFTSNGKIKADLPPGQTIVFWDCP